MICAVIATVMLFTYKNEKPTKPLKIGVQYLSELSDKYTELKLELETTLGIQVEFTELVLSDDENSDTIVAELTEKLSNNEFDMIIGDSNYYLRLLPKEELFLDLTKKIVNIDRLQKSILDTALKEGNGKIYTISPTIEQCYYLIENADLLHELEIEPTNGYITWNDYLEKLNRIDAAIKTKNMENVRPLAMVVQNWGEETVFASDNFLMFGYGLDEKLVEKDVVFGNDKWEDYFSTFCDIMKKYGNSYNDISQRFIFNTGFSTGEFATVMCNPYQLELFTADNLNINDESPNKIYVDFNMNIVPLPVAPGDEGMLNIRYSFMAINKNSKALNTALNTLNYLLSKDFTIKSIESRYEKNLLGNSLAFFPAYYDDDTIRRLNEDYKGRFDVNMIYNATKGNVIYNAGPVITPALYQGLDEVLSEVYNDRITPKVAITELRDKMNTVIVD